MNVKKLALAALRDAKKPRKLKTRWTSESYDALAAYYDARAAQTLTHALVLKASQRTDLLPTEVNQMHRIAREFVASI